MDRRRALLAASLMSGVRLNIGRLSQTAQGWESRLIPITYTLTFDYAVASNMDIICYNSVGATVTHTIPKGEKSVSFGLGAAYYLAKLELVTETDSKYEYQILPLCSITLYSDTRFEEIPDVGLLRLIEYGVTPKTPTASDITFSLEYLGGGLNYGSFVIKKGYAGGGVLGTISIEVPHQVSFSPQNDDVYNYVLAKPN